MRLLLDTHVFLWWITAPEKLSLAATRAIEDASNELLLSAASALEIATKFAIGKLPLPAAPSLYVPTQMQLNAVSTLVISLTHALQTEDLPWHHRDPFDRLLIAQAQVEAIPIITIDPLIGRYDVQVLW